ncbi:hypothetical protein ElyMa_003925200 [Elysia marginata]|uniref:Uncharacterized protein n=1 Tax=Elysia marginata TaxID=1093978 RepID=A0AAV4FTH9_9GAST|nr:hypothetical protein ElyMa_003925200 [Elysia marginata]
MAGDVLAIPFDPRTTQSTVGGMSDGDRKHREKRRGRTLSKLNFCPSQWLFVLPSPGQLYWTSNMKLVNRKEFSAKPVRPVSAATLFSYV